MSELSRAVGSDDIDGSFVRGEYEYFQTMCGHRCCGDLREFLRSIPCVVCNDSNAGLASFLLLHVGHQPVRRFGDGAFVDGGRSHLTHDSAAASGSKRDGCPEHVVQLADLFLTPAQKLLNPRVVVLVARFAKPPVEVLLRFILQQSSCGVLFDECGQFGFHGLRRLVAALSVLKRAEPTSCAGSGMHRAGKSSIDKR